MYSLPNTIRAIESRMMRWVGQVALMRMMINAYKNSVRKREGKNHLEDLDVDERVV
jgi:hypothetical protein